MECVEVLSDDRKWIRNALDAITFHFDSLVIVQPAAVQGVREAFTDNANFGAEI